jgi:hypothetical protein
MNNTLFGIRNPGRLVCTWKLTGDSKTPLGLHLEADWRQQDTT